MTRPRHVSARFQPTLWARLAVVLLAVLQVIAPSWHVCDMAGGDRCASTSHHGMAMAGGDDDAQRPLICYCAEKPHADSPVKDRLEGVEAHSHSPFCLALLLQSMPGSVAAVVPFHIMLLSPEFTPPVRRESAPPAAPVRHFEARGPPLISL
jgi:hypothetical protein